MKYVKTLGFFLCSLAILASCKPEPIDIALPAHQQKLVITSQIIPYNLMFIGVTKSFSSLTGNNNDSLSQDSALMASVLVDRALVVISYSGKTDTLQKLGPGVYFSANLLNQPFQSYTLYVKDSASGLECTSISTMLPMVTFDSIKPIIDRTGPKPLVYLEYSFTDPAENNFYMLNLYKPNTQGNIVEPRDQFTIGSQDNNQTKLLTDKLFVNGRYRTKQLIDVSPTDTIAFTLSNISQDYYQFLTAYQKSGKLFNQITGEPINYPSNISKGYGFFNTHNPDIYLFDLSKY